MKRLSSLLEGRIRETKAAAEMLGGQLSVDTRILLERDRPLGRAGEAISPNGACHLLRARDGHVAINLARDDDRMAIQAWLAAEIADDVDAVAARVAGSPVSLLKQRALMLHLPFAVLGESAPTLPRFAQSDVDAPRRPLHKIRVLDLSALWAGPLCGALLAQAGATVVRCESPDRRDPGAFAAPGHYQYLNDRKQLVIARFEPESLNQMLRQADVLITSARPHALARLGIDIARVFARERPMLWIAVTAHGWSGEEAMRVGFGDDCAVAGGLVGDGDDGPVFIGDAIADPLTGLEAARAALAALTEGKSGLIDCALAPVAAWYANRIKGPPSR